jgi:MipA family protein
MRKAFNSRELALAGAFAGFVTFVPCYSAIAGGFIDLDFENVPIFFGMGVGMLPDYSGSNDYTYGVAPFFRYSLPNQKQYVQLIANELTINLLDSDTFRFGPLANYHFGRSDVDDALVNQMVSLDDTVELGAFADIVWTDPGDKRHRFIVGGKVYQDVGNKSDGFRANLNARYWYPVAKPVDLNVSAGFFYEDDKYSNYYYGVNAGNVGTSGLPFFTANGGVNEYYAVLGSNIYLSKNWLVSAGIRGSIIAGDPADSPIVDQRGSSTQWIGGIGLGYIMW